MTRQLNLARIGIILMFVIAFTTVGWMAPVLYASHVPAGQIMEVHSFQAQDTTTGSDSHYVCLDRTVHQPTAAQAFTELYIVDGNGTRVEIESQTMSTYFQQGNTNVISPFNLPEEMRSGTYRYLLAVKMEMADGRVVRTLTYESDTFNVTEGPERSMQRPASCR